MPQNGIEDLRNYWLGVMIVGRKCPCIGCWNEHEGEVPCKDVQFILKRFLVRMLEKHYHDE